MMKFHYRNQHFSADGWLIGPLLGCNLAVISSLFFFASEPIGEKDYHMF